MRISFYAVKDVGILTSWPDVEEALKGLPNPTFKSFRTLPAAEAYLAGWDASSPTTDNTPFGFSGPETIPPTPTHKLGLPFQEHVKRKFSAPSSAAINPPSASSSSSRSKRPQPVPSLSLPAPGLSRLQAASPDPSFRRRSPLIQIVVEEEEDENHVVDELTPPSSAGSELADPDSPGRSRAGSTSGESTGGSLGKRRKSILGLGLGNILSFSPARPLTPPASPELVSQRSISPPSTDARQHASNATDTRPKSKFMIQRELRLAAQGESPSAPTAVTLPVARSAPKANPPARSLWTEAPVSPTLLAPPVSPPIRPSYSPDTSATSPHFTPFTDDSAPVFSRSSSSGTIVLPLRSPTSSEASLHRPRSNHSLRNAPSSSSIRSFSSGTSGLRSPGLEPPRLSRYGSFSSSAGGSNDSLSELGARAGSGWGSVQSSAAPSSVRLDDESIIAAEPAAPLEPKKAKGQAPGGSWMRRMKSKVFGGSGGVKLAPST